MVGVRPVATKIGGETGPTTADLFQQRFAIRGSRLAHWTEVIVTRLERTPSPGPTVATA